MENSILDTIKSMLGITYDYTPFDTTLITHINTVLANLAQIGLTEAETFSIEDNTSTWNDLLGDDKLINNVRSYIYLKVKLLFDPPVNNSQIESINNQINELEYRIYTQKGGY